VTDARRIADALVTAERTRTPIRPFTRAHPFLDAAVAYRAQWLFVQHRLDDGETVVGAKLGLTSKVKQHVLGIHEPLYGWLTSGMVLPPGEPLPVDQLIRPRAEPEIAFLIGERLEPPATVAGVLAATRAVVPAIEVLDSRYCEPFRLPDSVADNAGAARIVLGSSAVRPADVPDLAVVGCVFRSGGAVVGTAAGGAVMGHPAAAVAWLVNTLAAQGRRLAPGSVVLSGGLTAPVALPAGHGVSAEFDGLGRVDVVT
jgi:2-oxo-3-hexenedioate decarboxylase